MAERKPLAHPVPSGQNGCKSVFYLFDVGDQEVVKEDIGTRQVGSFSKIRILI